MTTTRTPDLRHAPWAGTLRRTTRRAVALLLSVVTVVGVTASPAAAAGAAPYLLRSPNGACAVVGRSLVAVADVAVARMQVEVRPASGGAWRVYATRVNVPAKGRVTLAASTLPTGPRQFDVRVRAATRTNRGLVWSTGTNQFAQCSYRR